MRKMEKEQEQSDGSSSEKEDKKELKIPSDKIIKEAKTSDNPGNMIVSPPIFSQPLNSGSMENKNSFYKKDSS